MDNYQAPKSNGDAVKLAIDLYRDAREEMDKTGGDERVQWQERAIKAADVLVSLIGRE